MIRKFITLALVAISIAGCSSAGVQTGTVSEVKSVFEPAIGTINKVYMGDRMMWSGIGWYVDCLTPHFDYSEPRNLGMATATIRMGEPMCSNGIGGNTFTPDYVNWTPTFFYPVTIKPDGKGNTKFVIIPMGVEHEYTTVSDDKYTISKTFKTLGDSFQQTIEYAGKNGEVLNFTYSEFKDGMARDAFTREFTVDLSQGKTMAYKGAVVEIIEATNTYITYKIVRYFK